MIRWLSFQKGSLITQLILLAVLSINAQINIQDEYSKHNADRNTHDRLSIKKYNGSRDEIIGLNKSSILSPSTTVFGYFPYWKYPASLDYLQYDLLSHIAIFDFDLSASGSINNPPNWPWIDLINEAHENGVKVVPCIVNFNGSDIHTILNNKETQQTIFASILSIIQQYALDGVNIDFEGVYQADRGSILNDFMEDLTNYLHAYNPEYEVSFAGPAVNWGGWELEGLANACDYIFIMGYNFWGGWSETSGPCAPLIGGAYNLTNTVTEQYGNVTASNPDKLILGIPYYGNKWVTDGISSYADVLDHINQPTYKTAMDQADVNGLLWDTWSETSWSLYSTDNYYRQTWFDTDSSTGLKYDLAEQHSLKGVGMWALGYDGDRTELWDELRKRYGQNVGIPETIHSFPIHFSPNPFNKRTKFFINLDASSRLKLHVQDVHGNVLSNLCQKLNLLAGRHVLELDMAAYPAGIYFVRLIEENGDTIQIGLGKAILVK